MATILIADDEIDIREALRRVCQRDGHEVIVASNGREAVDLARTAHPDLVVLDNRMPGLSGLEALARIRQNDPAVMALLYTAYADPRDVHEAVVELGAYGYLLKTSGGDAIRSTIHQALRSRGLVTSRVAAAEPKGKDELDFAGMLGRSSRMQEIFALIRKIGHSDVTVLIQGESGTGKELVARAVHEQGLRARGPYVTVDCGSLPDTLIESELFGYEAGAFTDARKSKPGKVEVADGGTLFLDEIGNLPLPAQAKLLRVIEERRLTRLGDTVVKDVDVRIVAATNLDLEQATRAKIFREDLYYRLNVFKLWLPPLRDRREDIQPLVEYFVRHLSGPRGGHSAGQQAAQQGRSRPLEVAPDAMAELVARTWPGNVRELRNVIERAVLLSGDRIEVADLAPEGPALSAPSVEPASAVRVAGPAAALPASAPPPGAVPGEGRAGAEDDLPRLPPVDLDGVPLKQAKKLAGDLVERAYIVAALRRTHWNKSKAAKLLGLNYKTLREKIQELDLEPLRWS